VADRPEELQKVLETIGVFAGDLDRQHRLSLLLKEQDATCEDLGKLWDLAKVRGNNPQGLFAKWLIDGGWRSKLEALEHDSTDPGHNAAHALWTRDRTIQDAEAMALAFHDQWASQGIEIEKEDCRKQAIAGLAWDLLVLDMMQPESVATRWILDRVLDAKGNPHRTRPQLHDLLPEDVREAALQEAQDAPGSKISDPAQDTLTEAELRHEAEERLERGGGTVPAWKAIKDWEKATGESIAERTNRARGMDLYDQPLE